MRRDGPSAKSIVEFPQPTLQPTVRDVLHDFRAFWQSPRSCKFYKGRSQEKTHLLRLKFSLLLSPLDRARSVLLFRALRSVAGLGFLYQRFSSLLGDEACQFRNQQ